MLERKRQGIEWLEIVGGPMVMAGTEQLIRLVDAAPNRGIYEAICERATDMTEEFDWRGQRLWVLGGGPLPTTFWNGVEKGELVRIVRWYFGRNDGDAERAANTPRASMRPVGQGRWSDAGHAIAIVAAVDLEFGEIEDNRWHAVPPGGLRWEAYIAEDVVGGTEALKGDWSFEVLVLFAEC